MAGNYRGDRNTTTCIEIAKGLMPKAEKGYIHTDDSKKRERGKFSAVIPLRLAKDAGFVRKGKKQHDLVVTTSRPNSHKIN